MQKRTQKIASISSESLRLDVPAVDRGVMVGGFLPADGTETELKPNVVLSDEVHETSPTWAESAAAVRAAAAAKPDDDAPVPEHVDIGSWVAEFWRGRPLWRHKRTGQTLHKRDEVRRQRNLK